MKENKSVVHGRWGEDAAAEWLVSRGYAIVDRNVRPCGRDARLELDIVAYDKSCDAIVFAEVKQHASRSDRQRRIRSVDGRKKRLLLRACRSWLRRSGWEGSYRFDVLEVYGSPESRSPPAIDHVRRVRLFSGQDRFVNWED